MLAARGGEYAAAPYFRQPGVPLPEADFVGDDGLSLGLAVVPEAAKDVGFDEALQIPNVVGGEVVLVADDESIDVLGIQPIAAARPVTAEQLPEGECVVEHRGLEMKPRCHEAETALVSSL